MNSTPTRTTAEKEAIPDNGEAHFIEIETLILFAVGSTSHLKLISNSKYSSWHFILAWIHAINIETLLYSVDIVPNINFELWFGEPASTSEAHSVESLQFITLTHTTREGNGFAFIVHCSKVMYLHLQELTPVPATDIEKRFLGPTLSHSRRFWESSASN